MFSKQNFTESCRNAPWLQTWGCKALGSEAAVSYASWSLSKTTEFSILKVFTEQGICCLKIKWIRFVGTGPTAKHWPLASETGPVAKTKRDHQS